MEFPNRPPEHVTESKSWIALQNALPPHWIPRNITERDYGIDAYVELVTTSGQVQGDLVSIQLKGIETGPINWKSKGDTKYFDFAGTAKATVNYWMNLPVPVFLCVSDVRTGQVWFADVKDQMRQRFDEYLNQKTFTFELFEDNELTRDGGLGRFVVAYFRERQHDRFTSDLVILLSNAGSFVEFLQEHLMRDCFLTLEPDELLRFSQILATCRYVAMHLGIPWKVGTLNELYREDEEAWKPGYTDEQTGKRYVPVVRELHEGTVAKYVPEIARRLSDLLVAARHYITETQESYWRAADPTLYHAFEYNDLQYLLKELEQLR